MSIKLVVSDLDGTIIDKNNSISKKNFDAIKKLHKNKIKFSICTGKTYSVSKEVCDKLKADYGIFGNGTQIIDLHTEKELLRKTLSKDDLLFISTIAKRYNFHIHLYTINELVTEKLEYMDLRNYVLKEKNNTNLKFKFVKNILEYIENHYLDVFSMIISTQDNTLMDFKKLISVNKNIDFAYINKRGIYKDLIINKDYEYLNIYPANTSKHEAVKFLSEYLKLQSENVMTVGDNVNDYEMVKNAGVGVAVKDSYEELKKVAKYITTSSVSDGAFAEAINKFI